MDDLSVQLSRLPERVRQRFVFLEQRVYWEGRVSRSHLMVRFGISAPQASADIARYIEIVPGNVQYDASLKDYVPTPGFSPRYFQPDARKYLTELLLMSDSALTKEESWLGAIPAHDAVVRVRRKLDAETLRPIVLAIHKRQALEITYQSLSSPEPETRWIAPHALVFDGSRWHMRAWCYKKSTFGDFVLARTLTIGDTKVGNVDSELDGEWNRRVTLRLGTNPNLSDGQRRALELDFGMAQGFVDVTMRLCMVYYFTRHMGLDLREDLLPPERRQIVWLNRSEIEAIRRDVQIERSQ